MIMPSTISRIFFHGILRVSARPIEILDRHFYRRFKVNRLKRNGCYGIMTGNTDHFTLQLKKYFTRSEFATYGIETGIEDMKLVAAVRKQPVFRRLDNKKKQQLIALYHDHISSFITLDEDLVKYRVPITKVELPNVMNEILVYWQCFGDERDDELSLLFEKVKLSIWRKLADIFGNLTPQLKFICDRTHLKTEEMNRLFELADYGVNYRSVSHAGAILGSMKNTGCESPDEQAEKVPCWVHNRQKKRQLKAAREKALASEK